MKKAWEIESDYVDTTADYVKWIAENKISLVGVNTDINNAWKRFQIHQPRLTHVKWRDLSGDAMRTHLLPDGEPFGVPFVALLSKQGIVWSATNKLTGNFRTILAAAKKGFINSSADQEGENPDNSDPDSDPDPDPDPDPIDSGRVIEPTELGSITPGRLQGLSVKNCAGEELNFGDLSSGDHLLNLLMVSKNGCDQACRKNIKELGEIQSFCDGTDPLSDGLSCETFVLINGEIPSDLCENQRIVSGGNKFHSVFADLFDWRYLPEYEDPLDIGILPEVSGPLFMGFDRGGKVQVAQEGDIESNDIKSALASFMDGVPHPLLRVGADFTLVHPRGDVDFFDFRSRSRFTIVTTFDPFCGSCIEELHHWSAEQQLKGFCRDRPDFCQILLLEHSLPFDLDPDVFWREKKDGLEENDLDFPLYLDTSSDREEARFRFEYLWAKFPEWNMINGTALFDSEGKIVAQFPSEGARDPDPLLIYLKGVLTEDE